jgi:hypothetical protein
MFTIQAFVAFAALGSTAFWLLAWRGHRNPTRARRAPTAAAPAKAA